VINLEATILELNYSFSKTPNP